MKPMLMHFNTKLPIILATDASSYEVGAVLSHIGPNGAEHPVAFVSRQPVKEIMPNWKRRHSPLYME